MNNLALIYSNQGKYGESEQLQLKVFNLCKKVLGLEHLKTLSSISNLATLYHIQGKHKEAENLQMEMSNPGNPEN